MKRSTILAVFTFVVMGLIACDREKSATVPSAPSSAEHTDHDHDHEHHHHVAPHGGTLVMIGDHFAQMEFVLDAATGSLTLYLLDGEAAEPIRVAVPSIELAVKLPSGETRVALEAIADELTGEKKGDTSQFATKEKALIGVKEFTATVTGFSLKGQKVDPITFPFPAGIAEPDDDHDHDHKH